MVKVRGVLPQRSYRIGRSVAAGEASSLAFQDPQLRSKKGDTTMCQSGFAGMRQICVDTVGHSHSHGVVLMIRVICSGLGPQSHKIMGREYVGRNACYSNDNRE